MDISFRNNAVRSNGDGVADSKSDNKPEVVILSFDIWTRQIHS